MSLSRLAHRSSLFVFVTALFAASGCAAEAPDPVGASASAVHGGSLAQVWSRRIPAEGESYAILKVAQNAAGFTAMVGMLRGTADFGGGPLTSAGADDAFVAVFDPGGNPLWSRRFGEENEQWGYGVVIDDAGAVTIAGGFQGTIDLGGGPLVTASDPPEDDIFVARFDAAGNPVWSERFGGGSSGYERAYALALDGVGNVVVTGQVSSPDVDFGGGSLGGYDGDIFLLKLGPSGEHVWSRRFVSADDQLGSGVAVGPSGEIALTAYTYGTTDIGLGPVGFGGPTLLVAMFDAAGAPLWQKAYNCFNTSCALADVSIDGTGNVVTAGWFSIGLDYGEGSFSLPPNGGNFYIGYDPSGELRYAQQFGAGAYVTAAPAIDGGAVLCGHFSSTLDLGPTTLVSAGSYDVFVAKIDETGAATDVRRFGSDRDQLCEGLALDATGSPVLAGVFGNVIGFGGGKPLKSEGADGFLARLSP